MNKKIVALFLAFCTVVSLSACRKIKDNTKNAKDKSAENQETSVVTDDGSFEGSMDLVGSSLGEETSTTIESSEVESSTEETSSEEEPQNKRYISANEAAFHAGQKGGYSIWSTSKEKHCVDSEGYITFTFDAGESAVGNAYSAVLTKFNTYTRLRRASTGEILFTTEDNPDVHIIASYYNQNAQFADGYYIAYEKEESYDGVKYKIGVLNSEGRWIAPMSEEHPILKKTGNSISSETLEKKLVYCNEGMFYFNWANSYYLYNAEENSFTDVNTSGFASYDLRSIFEKAEFKNGFATGSYGAYGAFFKLSKDGSLVNVKQNYNSSKNENEGAKYYDIETDTVYVMGFSYKDNTFSVYSSNGDVGKTHDSSNIFDANGITKHGLAQLVFKNQEGTKYYTVINTKGEFLFEPIEVTVTDVLTPDGYKADCTDSYSSKSGTYAVIDYDGTVLFQIDEVVSDFGVRNDIVYYEKNKTYNYVPLYD